MYQVPEFRSLLCQLSHLPPEEKTMEHGSWSRFLSATSKGRAEPRNLLQVQQVQWRLQIRKGLPPPTYLQQLQGTPPSFPLQSHQCGRRHFRPVNTLLTIGTKGKIKALQLHDITECSKYPNITEKLNASAAQRYKNHCSRVSRSRDTAAQRDPFLPSMIRCNFTA